jgi:very-short-patch-repair endonuclease
MRSANILKTGRARRLRRDSTTAELRLWNRVRSRAIDGHKFVRQEPIGPYIADFVCRERRLIIELDGGQHADNERDRVRDRWLQQHDYRVLRFWNNDVMSNMEGVLETIANALRAETPPHPVSAFGENRPLPAGGER